MAESRPDVSALFSETKVELKDSETGEVLHSIERHHPTENKAFCELVGALPYNVGRALECMMLQDLPKAIELLQREIEREKK